jgi:hypothetical protein
MAERKALKSPPHVAASAGTAKKRAQNRIAVDRNGHLLDVPMVVSIIARGKAEWLALFEAVDIDPAKCH